MSKIGQYIMEQDDLGNNLMADYENHQEPEIDPVEDIDCGIWYRSAVDGQWYRNKDISSPVDRIRVYGQEFEPSWWSFVDQDEEYQSRFQDDLDDFVPF